MSDPCRETLARERAGAEKGAVLQSRRRGPGCVALLMLAAVQAIAQAPTPPPAPPAAERLRVGVFYWHDAPNDDAAFDGVQRGLAAAGYVCDFVVRRAGSDRELGLRQLDELVAAAPRLLFALGTQAALLARERVRTVPVVFTAVTNPVESGLAPNWEGTGANLCGNSNWIDSEKVLAAFRLAVPKLKHLGVLRSTAASVVSAAELRQMQRYLRGPGAPPIELIEAVVDRPEELEPAIARLRGQGVEALWVPIDHLIYQNTARVLETLRGSGVPVLSSSLRGAEAGATVGVLVDYELLGERAAALARAVLQGKAPGSLPVGTMQSYQVVVNLAAARATGYELPLSALLVADRILNRFEVPR